MAQNRAVKTSAKAIDRSEFMAAPPRGDFSAGLYTRGRSPVPAKLESGQAREGGWQVAARECRGNRQGKLTGIAEAVSLTR